MQLDLFGLSEPIADQEPSPPVISPSGAWSSPELLAFNSALKLGLLKEAIAILRNLKGHQLEQVLLASGLTLGSTKNLKDIINDIQWDLMAAARLKMTGHEFRSHKENSPAQEKEKNNNALLNYNIPRGKMMEELHNRKQYPAMLATQIERMGAVAISIANRWMLGWPGRVKSLIAANRYLDSLENQMNQEKDILAQEANLRHLSRREILAMHEIKEEPPTMEA